MPINDGSGVLPGAICASCAKMQNLSCPWGNHLKTSTLTYKSGPNGVCMDYAAVENMEDFDLSTITGGSEKMKKQAAKMTDSELNVSIYRQIKALNQTEQRKLFNYWQSLFPKDFAKDMVTDSNESGSKNVDDPKKRTKKKKEKKKEDVKFTD